MAPHADDDGRDGQEQEEVPVEVVPPMGVFTMITVRHDLPGTTAYISVTAVYPAGTTRSAAYGLILHDAARSLGVAARATSTVNFYCEPESL